MEDQYQVAVIENGKVLRVYPQSSYNKQVIEQYAQKPNCEPYDSLSAPVATEPAQNLETDKSFEQQTQAVNAQTTKAHEQQTSAIEQIGHTVVKPFHNMAYTMGAGLFISLVVAVIYRLNTGKSIGKAFFVMMQAITMLLAFAVFLDSFK